MFKDSILFQLFISTIYKLIEYQGVKDHKDHLVWPHRIPEFSLSLLDFGGNIVLLGEMISCSQMTSGLLNMTQL